MRLAASVLTNHTAVCKAYGNRVISCDKDYFLGQGDSQRIVLYPARAPSDPGVPLFEKTRK